MAKRTPSSKDKDVVSDLPKALAEHTAEEEPVLRKYAGVVHIGADLTLYQRRAFNVLLFWAMPEMPRTTRHEIGLDDLAWGMGLPRASQRMQRLVENLDKMMNARVVWNLLDERGGLEDWESSTLLPYVKVVRKTRTVSYEFTRAFQDRVYNPSEFAEIALRMQKAFSSEHALALYENTRRFLQSAETPWIALDTFRTLMGVQGKPYYDEYKYLSARLIKPAMKQISECSDIQLQIETKRLARSVVEVKFLITANPQMVLFTESLHNDPPLAAQENQRRTLLRLTGYGITGKRAEGLLSEYTEEEINAGLDAADAWMDAKEAKHERIANPAGVAFKAITEHWLLTPNEASTNASADSPSSVVTRTASMLSEARQDMLRHEFRNGWYARYYDELSPRKRTELLNEFEQWLCGSQDHTLVLERFRKHGVTGMVKATFQHFLTIKGIEPDDLDFQAFIKDRVPVGKN